MEAQQVELHACVVHGLFNNSPYAVSKKGIHFGYDQR